MSSIKKITDFSIQNDNIRELMAECLGTFTLVCLGCSATISLVLSEKNLNFIPLAWGLALSVAIYISGGVSGGHVNPAVSLGMATVGKLKWSKLPFYFIGQYLGAFFGSLLSFLVYNQTMSKFPHQYTGIFFATSPNPEINGGTVFFDEMISTMFFLLIISAVTDQRNMKLSKGLIPLIIGLVNLSLLIMAFSYNSGAPINPARDLMPRIMMAMCGWKNIPFIDNFKYFWIPIVACHIGGILGCWIYKFFIENHWKNQ